MVVRLRSSSAESLSLPCFLLIYLEEKQLMVQKGHMPPKIEAGCLIGAIIISINCIIFL